MIDKLSSRTARYLVDGVIVAIALCLAYLARYDGRVPLEQRQQLLLLLGPIVACRLALHLPFGLHKHKWRYIDTFDAMRVLDAYASFSLLLLCMRLFLPPTPPYGLLRLPIGVIGFEFMFSLTGTLGVRALRRFIDERSAAREGSRVTRNFLVVGAGMHGVTVASEMMRSRSVRVVGFVDDDPKKLGSVIRGVPVLGRVSSLPRLVEHHKVDEVLVCVPPTGPGNCKMELPDDLSVRMRTVPTLNDFLSTSAVAGRSPETVPDRKSNRVLGKPIAYDDYPTTSIRDRTILITGGAGFIGSSLAEKLVPDNEVVLFDLTFRDKPVQFTDLLSRRNVRMVEGNLLDTSALQRVCEQVDMVVHAAAVVGVNKVCSAARETLETNYVGTSRLLQAIETNKRLERFIYFSSSEVFGVNSFRVEESTPPSVGPIAETRWSYAIAKLAGEHLVKAYSRETGMPIVIVRPFNVFGPKRTGEHALLRFIVNALLGKPVLVHGDGSQIRSWCYIDDFCAALLSMLERPEAVGEDFNIGNASNTLTIHELARKVVEVCGNEVPIKFEKCAVPDIGIRVPVLTKAQSLLGYKPRYDLDSALPVTVDWYRDHLDVFDRQDISTASSTHIQETLPLGTLAYRKLA